MRISETVFHDLSITYPLDKLHTVKKILFLDIETTGFTARSSSLYMIGCAYCRDNIWKGIQWMAEKESEEAEILQAFFSFAADYDFLIHFNGNTFDLPYLVQKCQQLDLPYHFDSYEGLDLYRRISSCKSLLNLPNCKQKTLECFLGLDREDRYNGGELIEVYKEYCAHPTEEAAKTLLLHNAEDIKGMVTLLPLLAYHDALNQPLRARKVQANHYKDAYDNRRTELMITLALPTPLPKEISVSSTGCFARMSEEECIIRVPVLEGELKYFYSNYKEYYYLPAEDLALHKSVATFVDAEHRTQATAQNCYTRKYSQYLRQWDVIFQPFFKKDYASHEYYFELTDELKKDRGAFAAYASHILNVLCNIL